MQFEEYLVPAWKAGEIVLAGEYVRIDDQSYKRITLNQDGPLPPSFDGHVAWYRAAAPIYCNSKQANQQTGVTTTHSVRTQRQEISDPILAQQALTGDQQAFETLVYRYQSPIFSFICRYLGDYHLACDITQNVFLQLYISLPTLRTDNSLKGWLFRVARNRCLDELRRKRTIYFCELETTSDDDDLSVLATLSDEGPLPEELAEYHDLQQALQQAIDGLPPKHRSVVLLRYAEQLRFSEIAEILQIPEATAKTYFQRSRPLLRVALSKWWQIHNGALV